MLYQKNLPAWERGARVLAALALIALGLLWVGGTWGVALAVAGAGLGLTGFVGFCPACAMAGRRIDRARGG